MENRFTGKVALVTGGVSGIGAAVTKRLLNEGATVVAIDVAEARVNEFREQNAYASLDARRIDVTDSEAITALVGDIADHYGRLDVVVANAGVVGAGRLGDITDAEWARVLNVDLNGVFHVIRAALPQLVDSRGSIVVTASISGLRGDYAMAAYDTAKGAVTNLTRSVAVDYGQSGVRANAVAPGIIATPMSVPILETQQEIWELYKERVPSGRVGSPEDVAAAILFLASDDAAYVNGVILPVDGGLTAWSGQPKMMG